MLRKIKNRLKKNKDVKVERQDTIRQHFDKTMEAITFAEAGAHEVAQQVIEQYEAEPRKVLVVGEEGNFSRPVVDYALGFAERMGYHMVVLNVLPVPTDNPELKPYSAEIDQKFRKKCEQSVADFRNACGERGIPFQHIVKTGDLEHCIKETHQEIKRIEFVICDPEVCPSMAEEVEEGIIPVFCLANA